MKSWVRHTLRAGVLAAGFLLFASTSPAQAADQTAALNSGIATGNNISVPIAVAANVCGNGVGVLGAGVGVSDVCVADASNEESTGDQTSVLNTGIVAGNNVSVPIAVAANVCGNGVGVAGIGVGTSGVCVAKASNDGDDNGQKDKNGYKNDHENKYNHKGNGKNNGHDFDGKQNGDGGQLSALNSGILTGNNISVPIAVAANVCGNGVGVLGGGLGISGVCVADASNEETAAENGQVAVGNSGILTGNNISIPVAVALNVCGNGVGVLGIGVGISDVCVANASNDGEDNGKKDKNGKDDKNGYDDNGDNHDGMESGKSTEVADTEVLPTVGAPLPLPAVNDTALPLLGNSSGLNSPDLQLPATGNDLGLPL